MPPVRKEAVHRSSTLYSWPLFPLPFSDQSKTMQKTLVMVKMATPLLIIIIIATLSTMLVSAKETPRQFTRKLSYIGYDCSQAEVKRESFTLSAFKNNTPEWTQRRILLQELWNTNIAYPYAITRPWKSLENVVYVHFKGATYMATCPATTLYESNDNNCYHNRARPVITQEGRDSGSINEMRWELIAWEGFSTDSGTVLWALQHSKSLPP